MRYICNAFSLGILGSSPASLLAVRSISAADAAALAAEATSAVGHASTATIFAGLLGRPVEMARLTLTLSPGDEALVGQYIGPRLPEGATSLPDGARIDWKLVRVDA